MISVSTALLDLLAILQGGSVDRAVKYVTTGLKDVTALKCIETILVGLDVFVFFKHQTSLLLMQVRLCTHTLHSGHIFWIIWLPIFTKKKLSVLFETGYKCHEFGQKLNEEAELARKCAGLNLCNDHDIMKNHDCLFRPRSNIRRRDTMFAVCG